MWENARKRCLDWAWLMLNLFHHLSFAASKLTHRPTLRIFLTHHYTSCVFCGCWVATGRRAPARTGLHSMVHKFCLSLVCPDTRLYGAWKSAYFSSWYGSLGLQLNGTIVNTQRYTHNILIGVRLYGGWGCVEGATCTHSSLTKLFGTALLSSIYIYPWVYIYVKCCSADGAYTRLQRIN